MARLLLVEDDLSLRRATAYNLRREGYSVAEAADGEEALRDFAATPADLVLLDVVLPKLDGFEVCRRLRRHSSVPIVMLTARGEEVDRVVGLEIGADDYLVKPFSVRELLARIKAILRRRELLHAELERHATSWHDPILVGPLRIDPIRRQVARGEREVLLRPKEFDLLAHLARHPNQIFTPEQLIEQVWGYAAEGDVRTVRVHVRALREKLELDPSRPELIETVRNLGYRLVE